MEDLDKAAHMGALKIVGQVHKEIDGGGGVLCLVIFVQYADRILYVSHADFLKRNFAGVLFVLNISHRMYFSRKRFFMV